MLNSLVSKLLKKLSKNRLINKLKNRVKDREKFTIQVVEKALETVREFTTVLIFKLDKPTEIASLYKALRMINSLISKLMKTLFKNILINEFKYRLKDREMSAIQAVEKALRLQENSQLS